MGQNGRNPWSRRETRLFLVLAAGQLLLLALILLFGSIKYEVSDDFIMEMVVSGAYTGVPDAHMMFSNIIWGWLLTPLYHLAPQISWYFWGQMLLCLGSYLALSYLMSHELPASTAVLAIAAITAFTARDLYILPQFTKTAAAAIISGGLLFLWALLRHRRRAVVVCGALLAVAGTLVRFSSFFVALPFAGLYLIWASLHQLRQKAWSGKQVLWKLWLPSVALFAVIIACWGVDSAAYQMNEDYHYYRSFSQARSTIQDYSWCSYEECAQELSAIGLSENDYQMILEWDFADHRVFTLETMQQVAEIVTRHRAESKPGILEALYMIKARQLHYPAAVLCVILGLLLIVTDWKRGWIPVLSAGLILGFLVYFYRLGRWVYRVEFSYFFCAAALIACTLGQRIPRKVEKIAFVLAAALIAGWQLPKYLPDSGMAQLERTAYRERVDGIFHYSWNYNPQKYTCRVEPGKLRPEFLKLLRDDPDKLYILDFATTIQSFYYDFGVMESSRACAPKNALYLAGVTEYHPSVQNYVAELGYENLMEALLEDSVYFVSNGSSDMILQFFHEHGYEDVEKEACGQVDGYELWQYHRTTAAAK